MSVLNAGPLFHVVTAAAVKVSEDWPLEWSHMNLFRCSFGTASVWVLFLSCSERRSTCFRHWGSLLHTDNHSTTPGRTAALLGSVSVCPLCLSFLLPLSTYLQRPCCNLSCCSLLLFHASQWWNERGSYECPWFTSPLLTACMFCFFLLNPEAATLVVLISLSCAWWVTSFSSSSRG